MKKFSDQLHEHWPLITVFGAMLGILVATTTGFAIAFIDYRAAIDAANIAAGL